MLSLVCAIASAQTPVISEFMASNNTTLADQDGDYADWLELYNPGPSPAAMGGWYLTDKASKPTKWEIPAVTIPAGGYLVIFCSEKNYTDSTQPMATNFDISSSSSYLGLVEPDGKTVASSYAYPVQYPDVSYGTSQPTDGSSAQVGYFAAATPGAWNSGNGNILIPDMVSLSPGPTFFTGTVSVGFSGASGSEHYRYDIDTPSVKGDQVSSPTASSTAYSAAVPLAGTALLDAAVFTSDDFQRGLPLASMFIQLDDSTANRVDMFRSALPLLVFDDNGFGLLPDNDTDYPGWMAAFNPPAGGLSSLTQPPDFFAPDTMKLHGFTSASFLKQSYDIDITDQLGNDLDEAVFGMDSSKSWDSIGPWFYDRTFIHNAFAYSLSNSMGHWAPSTRFAEMFIHSGGGILDYTSYSGVTVMTDRIKVDTDRVNIYSLQVNDTTPPNVTGGYILRVDHPEGDLYQWTTSAGYPVMLDTPKLDVLVQPQIDYITGYVQQMENSFYADQATGWTNRDYLGLIDRPSWVDYHIINTFVENVDSFVFSEYLTKDVDGPIVAGPIWDYDRSMGSVDGRDANPQTWSPDVGYSFWDVSWWGVLATDPDFMQAWVDRWAQLRSTLFSDSRLSQLINELAAEVGPDAAARDIARWPDDAGRFGNGSWVGEVNNLQSWINTRANWIDSQFLPAPSIRLSGSNRTLAPQPGAQIVYTLNGSDPRLSGGAISPSAATSGSPVTFSATQGFLARSYSPSLVGTFPGSPWSAPVGADRLTNVSGRAAVSSGANALIEGFVITGPANSMEQLLIRADGPALSAFGVANPLSGTVLSLYDSSGNVLATNSGWSSGGNAPTVLTITNSMQIFSLAQGSGDSALVVSLPPGAYTMVVTGSNGASGTTLGEIYESCFGGTGLVNLSSRAMVPAGGELINGFIVGGLGPQQVLVRADGPALAAFGVSGSLPSPILQVFDASSNLVASNTGWSTNANSAAIAAAASSAGAFALQTGSADSALLLTLQPGSYTAVVSGSHGSSGIALAETYALH
ncbi:MAG TPA: CotH kinase family protein [Opitutaceae bacterium]